MAFLEYRPTQTLYQFSSTEGFRGIMRSKQIWCSDLTTSNDPRELRLGFEHFLEALKELSAAEPEAEKHLFLAKLEDDLIKYRKAQQVFCACFSLAKDELPMWNEYGDNYEGLAIGFRPTAITSMPGRIQRVNYVNENTQEGFRSLVREIANGFHANRSDWREWVVAVTAAISAVTALKHRSWSHEREIRFIHVQTREPVELFIPRAEFSDGAEVFWQRPLSRGARGAAVEYKAFPFGVRRGGKNDPSSAIETVVIGPRCPISKSEVEAELNSNGFENYEVENSECQIR